MAPKESAALASSRADQASRRSMKNQRRNEKHRIRQRMATNAAGTTTAINTPAVASETTNGMNEDAVVKTESDTSDGMEQIPRVPENSGSLAAQSHGSHTHSAAGHGIRSHYKPRRYGNSRTNRDYTTRTRDQLASNGFAGLNNRIGPQQAPVGHAPPARRASRGGTRKRAAAQRAAAAAAAAQRGGAGAAAQRGGAGAAVAGAAGAAAAAQRGGAGAAAQRGGAGAAVTAAAGAAAAAQRGGGALVRGARRELPCRACLFALVNKSSNEACYDSLGAKQCSKCPDERSCVPIPGHVKPIASRLIAAVEAGINDGSSNQLRTVVQILMAIPEAEFHTAIATNALDKMAVVRDHGRVLLAELQGLLQQDR